MEPEGETTRMTLDELLALQPKLHTDGSGQAFSWQLGDDMLRVIDAHLTTGSVTLETGAGVSTVLFALKGARHVCIVPDTAEVDRITRFCTEHGIDRSSLRFEIDCSDQALPRLDLPELDLVLIDGAHNFPVPFIDWHYTAPHLKVGGLLVIDDAHIWTGFTLKQFLKSEPEWEIVVDAAPRSVVFRKIAATVRQKNECAQRFVARETIDLMFTHYPAFTHWLRPYFPEDLYLEREKRGTRG